LRSLAETMQSIQKELNAVGKLDFVVYVHDLEEGDNTVKYSFELSGVLADPSSCTIKFHYKMWMRGEMIDDEDQAVGLKEVLGLSMLPSLQHDKLVFEREKGSPDEPQIRVQRFEPGLFMVAMRTAGDDEEAFSFVDEKAANRVATAMSRAVKLCGGKNGAS
jgi:hypothetical protein